MSKFSKMTFKLVAVTLALAIVPLTGCNLSVSTPATICHATGDQANPYVETTVTNTDELNAHIGHPDDILPMPAGGCPATLVVTNNGKITICHATSSKKNPYNEITVSVNGLNGHGKHAGDIIPAPESGCPESPLVFIDGEITICHATGDQVNPYQETVVNTAELNDHLVHPDDILPMPASGCPASLLVFIDGETTICHATGDKANPYQETVVNSIELNDHFLHPYDILPMPAGGCPTTLVGTYNDKITICHHTSSKKNPYNEITVSVNGLNGHGKHAGDIIPAPAGGCP